MSTKLPDGVRDLITERVDSFEKLELVVALQAAPRCTMSFDALCRSLELAREVVREAITELRNASLVELTSQRDVQLLPATSRDQAVVAELVRLYNEDRFTVVKAMGEIAVNRIRRMASRTFAEAFVIRKKRPTDDNDA